MALAFWPTELAPSSDDREPATMMSAATRIATTMPATAYCFRNALSSFRGAAGRGACRLLVDLLCDGLFRDL